MITRTECMALRGFVALTIDASEPKQMLLDMIGTYERVTMLLERWERLKQSSYLGSIKECAVELRAAVTGEAP